METDVLTTRPTPYRHRDLVSIIRWCCCYRHEESDMLQRVRRRSLCQSSRNSHHEGAVLL